MATVDTADKVYANAVSEGHYDLYQGGLCGKHDNVRAHWEDQIRGIMLRPHLQSLVDRKRREGSKLRIVDLGAGSGQAFELLTSWMRGEVSLRRNQAKVLPPDMIQAYVGVDLSRAMVAQGNINYADRPEVTFREGDFSKGFPLMDEEPFDLYFCSYGSFSHIDDEAMEHLLSDIGQHAGPHALVVGEWLGRHSIEWPCYWNRDGNGMLDYAMSWLPPNGWGAEGPEHFPMCYWLGDEIRSLVRRVRGRTDTRLQILELYDCSILVGRHVDTGEYNPQLRPVRAAVNHLHEANIRTDLETLKVDASGLPQCDGLTEYFESLEFCWNSLVDYCERRLEKSHHPVRLKHWRRFPAALQMAIMTIDRVIDTVSWMRMGDSRANIIEAQLGYALRSLELEFQEGKGRGHALIGIFRVRKN